MGSGIAVRALSKTYRGGKVRALDGVSLTVAPGEVFGIIGPNGAGKTTLFGCMVGFLKPDAGEVTIDGLPPDDLAVHAVVGYLPERLMFDRWMTGRAFLGYHHELAGMPAGDRRNHGDPRSPRLRTASSAGDRDRDVTAALELTGLDPDSAGRQIRKYSRGMLQRLGFAQALIGAPRYLFLDEPTSGMDPLGAMMVRRAVMELKSRGAAVLINSHQLEQVEKLCDRVAFVKEGRVESVSVMNAGAGARRELGVRTAGSGFGDSSTRGRLEAAAAGAGAVLLESTGHSARFSVPDDETAAKLLAALVNAGYPVVEAIPAESRLERLFTEGQPGSGA